jgi:Dolichyl-phosphate-mannose-protein mannosyltransferase
MRTVRELVRSKARFFLLGTLAALALRLGLVWLAPGVVDDSRLYADIAKNWLQHGIYGVTNSGEIAPTLSRLPGYPAFLALIFAIFGNDNFRAVLLMQVLFDLGTCFLVADMAQRLFSARAAQAGFLLAVLCPFLANYAAAALTETLEIFFTALALDLVLRGLAIGEIKKPGWMNWLGCGLAVAGSILLRPDGGILLAAIGGYLLWLVWKSWRTSPLNSKASPHSQKPGELIFAGVLVAVGAMAPLVPWTMRNLYTLHRFQPLAPRYANDSDEFVMAGFNRWVKTWIADYVSVQEIYWPVPGSDMDFSRLPNRAFDSPEQRKETRRLFSEYNESHDMTPELDAGFAALAALRVRSAPLRYYLWLPALRIADMWLRPRTELFPSDPRWWEFNDDPWWLAVSLAFGAVNLLFAVMSLLGLVRSRSVFGIGVLIFFLLLRSAFLGSLENPEPRYTLECYPAVLLLASALFGRD